jgi:hypothetical protein
MSESKGSHPQPVFAFGFFGFPITPGCQAHPLRAIKNLSLKAEENRTQTGRKQRKNGRKQGANSAKTGANRAQTAQKTGANRAKTGRKQGDNGRKRAKTG